MDNWQPVSDSVAFTTKGITPKYVISSSIIVLNQKCIRDHKIDYSFAQYTDDTKEIAEAKFVKKGDILVNSTGTGTAGRSAFVSKLPKNKKLIVDSHILILRCNSYFEAQCLSYILFSFEKTLMSFMTGSSGQSELDKVVLLNLKTKMPKDLFTQQNIASVLSALDTKIELNNRINAELEAMAKTLYDFWFVQFDFPDEHGKPYKSSGGKMVRSKEINRDIPEGWEVGTLEQIVNIKNGFAFKSEDYQESGRLIIRTKNFDNNTIDLDDVVYISEEKAREYSDFELNKFDFLLVMVGASVGKSVIVPSYILPALQNQNMWNFLPKNENQKIYTNFLISRIVEEQAQSANGSARDFFRKDHFYSLKVAIPDSSIIEEFEKIAMPIFEKIDVLIKESQTLTDLRDWLLPMLMNGQVEVK